jgi:hypothetical protein
MATLQRTRKAGKRTAWTCPAIALAVLVSLARLPALAQAPEELPPPERTPAAAAAPVDQPAAPPAADATPTPAAQPEAAPADGPPVPGPASAPGCCPAAPSGAGAPDDWTVFVESGPLFAIGGGFDTQLDMGWTVDIGARQVVCSSGRSALFAELAGEYENLPAVSGDVRRTDVTAALPDGTMKLLRKFNRTRLVEIDHLGVEGGLGWTWDPGLFDDAGDGAEAGDRRLFLIGRVGLHGGATHAVFHETPTPEGVRALGIFAPGVQKQDSRVRLFDPVVSHEPYFGVFSTVGVGTSWCHASVWGVPLGDVSLTAEVELGYHWDDLGEFDSKATFLSISPKLTLGFSF